MKHYRFARQASTEHGGVAVWVSRVWLYSDYELCIATHLGGRQYQAATGFDGEGRMVFEPIDPGDETPVLCRMPEHVLEAVLKAVSETLPVDAGMQRHLTDAVDVRDRLLTLVEKTWTP